MQAPKEWQHYSQGSGHTTIILSDYNNLRHHEVAQTIGQHMASVTTYEQKGRLTACTGAWY